MLMSGCFRFEIDIEAKESGSAHRARARIYLWVYEPVQQLKLVVNKDPMQVNREKQNIIFESVLGFCSLSHDGNSLRYCKPASLRLF